MVWRPSRKQVAQHMYGSYGEEHTSGDMLRDPGWLFTKCLNFPHQEMHIWGIGISIRQ
jgi:hypothetical protein